jgi:hypothetical protein
LDVIQHPDQIIPVRQNHKNLTKARAVDCPKINLNVRSANATKIDLKKMNAKLHNAIGFGKYLKIGKITIRSVSDNGKVFAGFEVLDSFGLQIYSQPIDAKLI